MTKQEDSAASSAASDLDSAARAMELADPDAGAPKLDRAINKAAEAFGASLLISVFLIILINASGRYLVGRSLPWGEEVVIGVIPWISMAGLFLSVRRRDLITITYFSERLQPRTSAIIGALGQILCCSLFGVIAYLALGHVLMFGGDETPVLGTPRGLTYAAMLVGGLAVAIAFLIPLVRSIWTQNREKDI
jgi:TRAP-type C4-dicarboxylate transport system permease small subunit